VDLEVVVFLGVVAGVNLIAPLELTEVGLGFAGKDAQQAGLTGAVQT
jgi:hypothetical protein